MTPALRYRIEYRRSVVKQLAVFQKHQLVEIREAIDKQLQYEPTRPTHNRKPLDERKKRFAESEWELRCGQDNRFRVFYFVDEKIEW